MASGSPGSIPPFPIQIRPGKRSEGGEARQRRAAAAPDRAGEGAESVAGRGEWGSWDGATGSGASPIQLVGATGGSGRCCGWD